MFTLKHVHMGGEEDVLDVRSVRFTPGHGPTAGIGGTSSGVPPTIWITEDGHIGERPLIGGTIFVMNGNGKTVARYDLGGSPVPIIGDGLSDPRPRGISKEAAGCPSISISGGGGRSTHPKY